MEDEAVSKSHLGITKQPVSIEPDVMASFLYKRLAADDFAALWEIHENGRNGELHEAMGILLAAMCPECGKLNCEHGKWKLGGPT